MTEEDRIREAGELLAARATASCALEKLPELQKRIREQLRALEETSKRMAEEQDEADRKPSKSAVPKLLKAGGQGYRLWKSSHETLATEMSTRSPPLPDMVASPAVRSDAQRFQAALRATVGALDISDKAGRVMQELLNSEREYFTDLGMLQRLYVKPLTEGARNKGYFLTERDLGDLFSNFDDIFKLNLDLLRHLEVESKKPQAQIDAGQLFLDFADKFQVYAIYCANANAAKKRMEALALSNKRFAEFCEKARSHSAHKGLDIGSFLIKPLQRLCQYPLLLRELLEALPDQQNVPYAKLQQAHKVMSETVETVNGMLKSIRKRTELQRLSDLLSFDGFRCSVVKPGRQFTLCMPFRVKVIYPGEKEPTKKWKNWETWLLSDMVVLGEREKSKSSDRLLVKAWVPLEQLSAEMTGSDELGSSAATIAGALGSSTGRGLGGAVAGGSGGGAQEGAMSKRMLRKEAKEAPVAKDVKDCICLSANGAQFFLSSDDKVQSALWLKKLQKKMAQIKQLM